VKGHTVPESSQFILTERQRDTITIWLNHPERLNVLSLALMEELTRAFLDVGESDATGVILAAKGRLFCAGHDFAEMANQDLESVRKIDPSARRRPGSRSRHGRRLSVGRHR
jgi:enoyl-CoA hydratase/carnithine racemase